MFVSRKCLATLIHLFAREFSTGVDVAQLIHQRAIILISTLPACDPFQPLSEQLVQRRVPTPGILSGKLDVGLVGVECNVLSHEYSVHDYRVLRKLAFRQVWGCSGALTRIGLSFPFPVSFPPCVPCPRSTSAFRNRPGSSPITLPSKSSVRTGLRASRSLSWRGCAKVSAAGSPLVPGAPHA